MFLHGRWKLPLFIFLQSWVLTLMATVRARNTNFKLMKMIVMMMLMILMTRLLTKQIS